jgi:alpha-glucoside transport system substrate-binding protein
MVKSLYLGVATLALLAGGAQAQDLKFAPGEDARFNWASYEALKSMDLSGQKLRVFGPWITNDQVLIESVIAYFEAATGAEVEYTGSDSFEQQVVIDAEAGSPPDVAIFPQPGLAADMARKGHLQPLARRGRMLGWLKITPLAKAGRPWVATPALMARRVNTPSPSRRM